MLKMERAMKERSCRSRTLAMQSHVVGWEERWDWLSNVNHSATILPPSAECSSLLEETSGGEKAEGE